MDRPHLTDAPGIAWRRRGDGWAALWIARADMVKRGYIPKAAQLDVLYAEPDDAAVRFIRSECRRRQDEMLAWSKSGDERGGAFDGTMLGLSRCFQTDPDSPYRSARGSKTYLSHLKAIEREKGARALHALGARDFLRWYEEWAADGAHVPRAHDRMSMVRRLMSFGVMFELHKGQAVDHCLRLQTVLGNMSFANSRPRVEALSLAQAHAIRARAHAIGDHEIALAQAFQFELGVRQKDVIGQWLPTSDPGLSDVVAGGMKWMLGLRWDEIDADLWLEHRLSKSLRGKKALADPNAGKWKRWNLRLYPMIMEELSRITLPSSGPVIVDHLTALPFHHDNAFRNRWRAIADAVGVPRKVQNRDSRAGRVTEVIAATGGNLEAARKTVGHARAETTERYSRDEAATEVEVTSAVLAFRKKGSL
jgi:hypothetical protein